jgi:hypothetical protein
MLSHFPSVALSPSGWRAQEVWWGRRYGDTRNSTMGANDGRCPETDPAQARSCIPARGNLEGPPPGHFPGDQGRTAHRRRWSLVVVVSTWSWPWPSIFPPSMRFIIILGHKRAETCSYSPQTPVYKVMLLNGPVSPSVCKQDSSAGTRYSSETRNCVNPHHR